MNLQQNIHNRQFNIYNYAMLNYDPDKFADWLSDSFNRSTFKSFAALADAVGLSRSTVSALAGAKKQPLTDKPSQPKSENVIKLAKALGENVDVALNIAGYASQSNSEIDVIANRLASGVMASGFNDLEDEDLREAFLEDMQTISASMLQRRIAEQNKRKAKKN